MENKVTDEQKKSFLKLLLDPDDLNKWIVERERGGRTLNMVRCLVTYTRRILGFKRLATTHFFRNLVLTWVL